MEKDILKRSGGHRKKTPTPEIPPPARGATIHLPVYGRLPKSGERCPYTGLARSAVNDLILGVDPPVKSVVLARKGASRGIRLVHLGSLLEHLNGLMSQQETGKGASDE